MEPGTPRCWSSGSRTRRTASPVEFAHDRHRGDAARFVIRVVPDELLSASPHPTRLVLAELAVALEALEPVAGTRRGRARAARRRHHEPQLPAAAGRARRRRAAARERTPSCSGSTAKPSARRPRRRLAVGVGPEVVAFLAAPPCLVTAFIAGRPLTAEQLRAPEHIAQVAAALRASTAARDAARRGSTRSRSSPPTGRAPPPAAPRSPPGSTS